MYFSKAVLIGAACLVGCCLVVGCQAKRSDTGPAAETSVEPAQTHDQPSSAEPAPVASPQVITNEQQPVAHSAEMNQPTMGGAQEGAATSTDQSDADEGVSFGRMMGGLFRATRSLVPIPAATGDRQVESSDEAPRFPQP